MNNLAVGLAVRFLTVTMLAATCTVGSLIGSIFNPALSTLNFATEAGSIPINPPPATRVTVSCPESVTMVGSGSCKLAAWKLCRMSCPGTLS